MVLPKEKQEEILKQFREQLEQRDLIHEGDTIGTDDATLLRFLRARHFDLKAATTMWENCQNWRKTVEGIGIDELYRRLDPYDYPERAAVFECWPLWFHKTDNKGRPLNIHHFGGINMPELYKHITPERFWQTIVVNAESLTREVLPASARAAGHHIDGTFVIVDLKGFGLSQFWQMKNLARDSFQISQDYFPETMAQLAIINAPASFTTIWGFIKPWLAKETLAKIDILGTDYKDVLLKQIPAENLPESLGGTCTCAEEGGCKLSNAGPWMHNRKARREKWLRGERKRLGLGMEGEDEDDGGRNASESSEHADVATEQETPSEGGTKLAEQKQPAAVSKSGDEKPPADVPPEVVQSPEERQRSFAHPEPSIPPTPPSTEPVQQTTTFAKTTEVVAEQDTELKPAATSQPALSTSASRNSSSTTSSSSFQSARTSFGSVESLGSADALSAKTGASAATGTSSTVTTGTGTDSKRASIRKKLQKPLEKLGLSTLSSGGRAGGGEPPSTMSSMFGSLSRGTSRSADGTKAFFRRSRQTSAEPVVSEVSSRASSLDAGQSPSTVHVNGNGSEANSTRDAPDTSKSPVVTSAGVPPASSRLLSAASVKSVKDVYENHPETRQPQMGDFVQA